MTFKRTRDIQYIGRHALPGNPMWLFECRYGLFKIMRVRSGWWQLWLDDELLGSYQHPEAAADDVYCKATGSSEWDCSNEEEPTDLSDWEAFWKHPK